MSIGSDMWLDGFNDTYGVYKLTIDITEVTNLIKFFEAALEQRRHSLSELEWALEAIQIFKSWEDRRRVEINKGKPHGVLEKFKRRIATWPLK